MPQPVKRPIRIIFEDLVKSYGPGFLLVNPYYVKLLFTEPESV